MEKRKKLLEIGVDADNVIKQLGGNEEIYLTICQKFLQDNTFPLFEAAISQKNYHLAEQRIHTLKGVSANLGFIRLELLCRSLLDEIRSKNYSLVEQYNRKLIEEYQLIIHTLIEA